MEQEVSNIGQTGVASIRIGGMRLETLPIGEAAIAKQQWSEKQAEETRNKVKHILGRYPKPTVNYLDSRLAECRETIQRIKKLKVEQDQMIADYSGHISMCRYRDVELAKLDPEKESDKAEIRKLKLKYPPYDVAAMKAQIEQCKEALIRCDVVVEAENASIAEITGVRALCAQRDEELRQYGVKVG